jgi:hypothetical protein
LNFLTGRGNEAAPAVASAEVVTLRSQLLRANARATWLENILQQQGIDFEIPIALQELAH